MYTLREIPLFSSLSERQLAQLQLDVHVHQYDKNSILFYEGDSCKYLYILLEGEVRLYKTAPKGRQIHLHNFKAPEAVAIYVAFEKIPFPATCELTSDGYIGLLPLEKFDECLNDVRFSKAMLKILGQRMRLLSTLLHKETVYSAEAKIANTLYTNAAIFEQHKNTEIAAILNITPETLSRFLTKLKKENIIRIDHHKVTILNKQLLKSVVDTNSLPSFD